MALADEATAELARFDAEMGSEIAPFGAILLRSESAASSRIEHLTASAQAVALAELGDTSRTQRHGDRRQHERDCRRRSHSLTDWTHLQSW
jgi:hypothetical protein